MSVGIIMNYIKVKFENYNIGILIRITQHCKLLVITNVILIKSNFQAKIYADS